MVAFIKTPKSITLQFKGHKPYILPMDHPSIPKIMESIKNNLPDSDILNIVDTMLNIKKHVSGLFDIDGEIVYVKGEKLPPSLSERLIDFANNGILNQANILLKFWDNCQLNPDPVAKTDLYAFLQHNNIPLTEDGCFVAYKYVDKLADGTLIDSYTKTIVNNVGSVVKMDRKSVNSDRNQTCSTGLHVASFEYVTTHGGYVVIEVKVHPKNVVAIPIDYNGQKMRVCEYEVMAINCDKTTNETPKPITEPVYNNKVIDESEYTEDDIVDEMISDIDDDVSKEETVKLPVKTNLPKRDSRGRFVSNANKKIPKKSNNQSWKSLDRDTKGRFCKYPPF